MIDLLTQLVSINSIFPNEQELSEYLENYLITLGFQTERQYISENRFNLLAEKGNGSFSYLLYAHTDTVPVYGNWLENPFKLRVSADKAIGLGAADMKGGIAAILKAVENFNPQNYKLKIGFGVDEENFSAGAFKITESNWLKDVKGILVPESSLPAYLSEQAGSIITPGRKGRVVYIIKIFGKSAHGVNPEKGINAIEEAAKLVIELRDLEKTSHPKLGKNTYFVRRFEAKTLSLSIPDYAEIELDSHLVCPETSESLKKKLEAFINLLLQKGFLRLGEKQFEVIFADRPTPFLEPFIFDTSLPFIKTCSQAVEKIYSEFSYNYGQSVADENVFGCTGIPTLTIGPLADNHHSAEEWVSISSLNKLSKIYRKIIEDLDKDSLLSE